MSLAFVVPFKLQPKPIHWHLVEEIVTTDISKKKYGCHLNNLSFIGKWPKRRAGTHIDTLELWTVWKVS